MKNGFALIILSEKSWIGPGQLSRSIPKRNIYRNKVLICNWWNMKGIAYYELLKPNQTAKSIIKRFESCFDSETSSNS